MINNTTLQYYPFTLY